MKYLRNRRSSTRGHVDKVDTVYVELNVASIFAPVANGSAFSSGFEGLTIVTYHYSWMLMNAPFV